MSRPDSLQRKTSVFILSISFFLLALSVFIVHMALVNYERARSLEQTIQITENISQAMRELGLERGRMNVALLATSPVSEGDRIFIEGKRHLSDAYLSLALKQLEGVHPAIAQDLAMRFDSLKDLRQQADTESRKNFNERTPGIALFWLRQSTNYIAQLENSLSLLGKEQLDSGEFYIYHQLVQDSLHFRILAGYHATVQTAALGRPDLYSHQQYDEFAFVRMQADSLWSDIDRQVKDLAKPKITKAKVLVNLHYYNEYRPEQERLLSLARWQQIDSDSIEHLQKLSISAFDTIFSLIDATEAQMQEYVNAMQVKAKWLLAAGIAQFLLCLLLVAFCVLYFERRLFHPMQQIIHALERLGNNEEIAITDIELQRSDEIGQINKGVQRLQISMAEERRLKAEIEHLAMTDFLTGCLNKRAFYLRAEAELSRAARENTPISFMFVDLDDLKRLNDAYGHLVGDEAIKHFAACVTDQCRPYDLIGRFGGDEFVFCFPQTSEEQSLKIVQRIQDALEANSFQVGETDIKLQLHASFGLVSRVAGEDWDVEWFIHQADMALYQAKQSGKNCLILGSDQTC